MGLHLPCTQASSRIGMSPRVRFLPWNRVNLEDPLPGSALDIPVSLGPLFSSRGWSLQLLALTSSISFLSTSDSDPSAKST